ncbi:MAG TPA: calcium-binding protein, partial [Planctomycetaceae bacterium]|nr:calcium-binding protein [Planctomycetaceae bacterium]
EAGGSVTISSADHPTASQADDGLPDTFRLRRNGDNIEVLINDTVAAVVSAAAAPRLVLDGSSDDDTFVIDFSGGDPLPADGIVVNGQSQTHGGGDALQLVGGTAANVVYTFANASDGSIAIDGVTVAYTGLEPIRDELTAVERRFVFGETDDVIILDTGPNADDGMSRLRSESSSETVEFTNPTGTIAIDAAGGSDRVVLQSIDAEPASKISVAGGAGDDTLDGSAVSHAVTLSGGAGNDSLVGGDGDDQLTDPTGNDTLVGGPGDDLLVAGAGADSLVGGDGNDRLDGQGGSVDTLSGGAGDDILDGGSGTDLLAEVGDVDFGLSDSQLTGLGTDTLIGVEQARLVGGPIANRIETSAFSGPVTLEGGAGDDTLLGGAADDSLRGGPGDDLVADGSGNDTLAGDAGNDSLFGSSGRDLLDGGTGNDYVAGQG